VPMSRPSMLLVSSSRDTASTVADGWLADVARCVAHRHVVEPDRRTKAAV
jgi:hypothetical protein